MFWLCFDYVLLNCFSVIFCECLNVLKIMGFGVYKSLAISWSTTIWIRDLLTRSMLFQRHSRLIQPRGRFVAALRFLSLCGQDITGLSGIDSIDAQVLKDIESVRSRPNVRCREMSWDVVRSWDTQPTQQVQSPFCEVRLWAATRGPISKVWSDLTRLVYWCLLDHQFHILARYRRWFSRWSLRIVTKTGK